LRDEEFVEDWQELIAPDLEMQFAGEVGTFLSDLDGAQAVASEDSENPDEKLYRLDVPLDHGQAWFSTLNQARLLLDLKYKLHDAGEPSIASLTDEAHGEMKEPIRVLVLMRYEFYAWIQEWLVRHAL